MLPSAIRWAIKVPIGLRQGQTGGRGKAALTDRKARPPRYLVRARGGGSQGRLRLIRQLCSSLIIHGAMRTTLHRARGTQRRMCAYIRWAKVNSPRTRRKAYKNLLGDRQLAFKTLFEELGPRFRDAPSGFTHLLPLGPRLSDAAPMAIVQLRGTATDYKFHFAAMITGRQMAIQAQDFDTWSAGRQARAWRAGPLEEPVLPGNGRDLHPAYAHLAHQTQVRIVKALNGLSAAECREWDDLARYHYDRTLAQSRASGYETAQELEELDDADRGAAADGGDPGASRGGSVYVDRFPYVEGEADDAQFWAEEQTRRALDRHALDKGKLPDGVPRSIAEVGAQILPRGRAARALDDDERTSTPLWARSPRQLVKGWRAKPAHLHRVPSYSALSDPPTSDRSDVNRWKRIWAAGKRAQMEEHQRTAGRKPGTSETAA